MTPFYLTVKKVIKLIPIVLKTDITNDKKTKEEERVRNKARRKRRKQREQVKEKRSCRRRRNGERRFKYREKRKV